MKASYRRCINAFALLCALVSCCLVRPVASEEAKESSSKEAAPVVEKSPGELLFLELRHSGKPGDSPVQIFITNKGDTIVTLLEPEFGSHLGWRSPVVTWQVFKVETDRSLSEVKPSPIFVCGNGVNVLRSKDIFELAPGESRELTGWSNAPKFDKPGLYRARFYYVNSPEQKWRDWQHAPLIERMRQSTRCALISDELEFIVPEPAAKK